MTGSHIGLAPLILALCACSTPFGYSLEQRGGSDRPDDDDQIFMDAERVEGLASDLNALVIPGDWRSRPSRPVAPGVRELDPPIDFEWIAGLENLEGARRVPAQGTMNPDRWEGDSKLLVLLQNEDVAGPVPDLEPLNYDAIHERLLEGQDSYVLVVDGRYLKRGFDVYGATGPPISWVRLGRVTVESGESSSHFVLARTVGGLAYGLDACGVLVGYAAAIVTAPIGGFLYFQDSFMDKMPESPW